MKKLLIAGLLSVGVLFAYNPIDGVKAQKQAALKVVGNHFVTVKQAKDMTSKGAKFVDVREIQEFLAGHIKGSIHIPRGVLYGAVKKGKIKPNGKYIVVCRTGHRALLAAATLIKWYQFKNVYVLKGGIKAWIQNGNTVQNALHLGPVKIELTK
ncbi:MAG: rhodanese-like domain-containing protein [Epsilonproteobacteria bacterium]|nr:rhodanese-like domain-containing protein [Campylobacterota bacterium]